MSTTVFVAENKEWRNVAEKTKGCKVRKEESEERIKNLETELMHFKTQGAECMVQISQHENAIKKEQEAIKTEDQTLVTLGDDMVALLDRFHFDE